MRIALTTHPQQGDHDRSQARERDDPGVPTENPLELDPYSPIVSTRSRERRDADPLALTPYSPIRPTRAPSDHCPG
jgi:hypothetical protein